MTFAPLAARRLAEMISLGGARSGARADRGGAGDRAPRPGRLGAGTAAVVEQVRERLGASGTAAADGSTSSLSWSSCGAVALSPEATRQVTSTGR